jgi:hypothetical protein
MKQSLLVPMHPGPAYNLPTGILVGPPGWPGLFEGQSVPEALPLFGDIEEIGARLQRPALIPLGMTRATRARDSVAITHCWNVWIAPEIERRLSAGTTQHELTPIRDALVVFPRPSAAHQHRVLLNDEVRIVMQALPVYRLGGQPGEEFPFEEALDIRRLSFSGVNMEAEGFLWIRADESSVELYFNFLPARDDSSPITTAFVQSAATFTDELQQSLGRVVFRRLYEGVFATEGNLRDKMAADGWCPSPLLLPDAWRQMVSAYAAGDPNTAADVAIAAVSTKAFQRTLAEWRSAEPYSVDAPVLERGIERYLAGDYISATAVLLPRLEGLSNRLRGARGLGLKDSPTAVFAELDALASADICEAWLPQEIRDLLRGVLDHFFLRRFRPSDPDACDVLGRHAHAHGITAPEHYTQAYALKVILTLDALFVTTR